MQDGKDMYSPDIISPCSGKMGGTMDLVDFHYGRKDRLDEPSHSKRLCYLHQTKTATSYEKRRVPCMYHTILNIQGKNTDTQAKWLGNFIKQR